MFLAIHISLSVISIGYAIFVALRPSPARVRISYGLIVATVASGIYLTVVTPNVNYLRLSIMIVVYTAIPTILTLIAQHRLTTISDRQTQTIDR